MSAEASATLLRVGDYTESLLVDAGGNVMLGAIRNISGGGVVTVEKTTNAAETGFSTVTTLNSDQLAASVGNGVAGERWRMRLTTAVAAGGGVSVRLSKETISKAA